MTGLGCTPRCNAVACRADRRECASPARRGSLRGGPFDRPRLGRWLAWADEWDGFIVAKFDRLTRSLLDFPVLYKWLSHRQRACEPPELASKTSRHGRSPGAGTSAEGGSPGSQRRIRRAMSSRGDWRPTRACMTETQTSSGGPGVSVWQRRVMPSSIGSVRRSTSPSVNRHSAAPGARDSVVTRRAGTSATPMGGSRRSGPRRHAGRALR